MKTYRTFKPIAITLLVIGILGAIVSIARAADDYTYPMTCEGQAYQALADSRKDGAFPNQLKCIICKDHIYVKRLINGEWKPLGWTHDYKWGVDYRHCKGEQNTKVITYGECIDRLMQPVWLNR